MKKINKKCFSYTVDFSSVGEREKENYIYECDIGRMLDNVYNLRNKLKNQELYFYSTPQRPKRQNLGAHVYY